jgi:hypothetical protein
MGSPSRQTSRSLTTLDFTDGPSITIHRGSLAFTGYPLDFNDS